MTNDTMKSLGYLKKSLKMTKRALEKNKAGDNADPIEFDSLNRTIDDMLKEINVFAALNPAHPAPIVTPSPTAVNPTPPPSTSSTTDDDDLLTT